MGTSSTDLLVGRSQPHDPGADGLPGDSCDSACKARTPTRIRTWTPRLKAENSGQLSYRSLRTPTRIRTWNTLSKSQVLYPLSYRSRLVTNVLLTSGATIPDRGLRPEGPLCTAHRSRTRVAGSVDRCSFH